MEKQGYVSLWIGNIQTEEALTKYVELVYTDDGEFLPSPYLSDFHIDIDDFDEDFLERVFHRHEKKALSDLIGGCSYNDVVIPRFEAMHKSELPPHINTAILLYNFAYDARKKKVATTDYSFTYVGSVQYV